MAAGMRITQRMMVQQSMLGLEGNQSRLSAVQRRMTTGRAINKPSDDPSGTAAALRIRSELASGAMFSMPWRRQLRRWFSLAAHTVVTPVAWGWLAVLACLPHRGTPLVQATLNRPAAATPSPQAED